MDQISSTSMLQEILANDLSLMQILQVESQTSILNYLHRYIYIASKYHMHFLSNNTTTYICAYTCMCMHNISIWPDQQGQSGIHYNEAWVSHGGKIKKRTQWVSYATPVWACVSMYEHVWACVRSEYQRGLWACAWSKSFRIQAV